MSLQLDEVASGLGFPEGPVAMIDGSLLCVDIKDARLLRITTKGGVDVVAEIAGGPNGLAIGPDGAAYICNNGGVYSFVPFGSDLVWVPDAVRSKSYQGGAIQRVDLKTGSLTTLYDAYQGQRLLTPDDIVFDQCGGFYFTDSGFQDPEATQKGAVYYGTTDGTPLLKVAIIPMANGIGLSPDGSILYVSDTVFGRLWALDIASPGHVKPGPLPVMPGRVVQTLPGFQWLDSLKVEADGRICVGTIFNGESLFLAPTVRSSMFRCPIILRPTFVSAEKT